MVGEEFAGDQGHEGGRAQPAQWRRAKQCPPDQSNRADAIERDEPEHGASFASQWNSKRNQKSEDAGEEEAKELWADMRIMTCGDGAADEDDQ